MAGPSPAWRIAFPMYRDLKPGASLSVKVTRAGRQVVLNHTVQ